MANDENKDLSTSESMKEKSLSISSTNPIIPTYSAPKINLETQFSKKMDEVKENVLMDAQTDNNFVSTIKSNVKQAAVKLTEVEKDKAELQGQQIELESDKLTTQQNEEKHKQNADTLEDKRKVRRYHYEGVKPIMEFVGIHDPMNLGFLYFLAVILTPLYLIAKFCRGTFGVLLSGANDKDRGKAAKGFLWTLLAIFSTLIVICLITLFLKTQGVDLFANIKS